MEEIFEPTVPYEWTIDSTPRPAYDVSMRGDNRFHPQKALLHDGKSIDEVYQLDIKGYRVKSDDPSKFRGLPPLEPENCLHKIGGHFVILDDNENPELSRFCEFLTKVNHLIYEPNINSDYDPIAIIIAEAHRMNNISLQEYTPESIVGVYISSQSNIRNRDLILKFIQDVLSHHVKAVKIFYNKNVTEQIKVTWDLEKILLEHEYVPIANSECYINLYYQYKSLWREWMYCNMDLFEELAIKAHNKVITDVSSNSPINQARALCELLNEYYFNNDLLYEKIY